MRDNLIFNKNMLSLSSRNNKLAISLGNIEPSQMVSFKKSKKGPIIPILKMGAQERPLHSTIDPEREGLRYYSKSKASGYIVFLGLGAAYHIRPFLEQSDISEILIIDKDISLFKAILSHLDLSQFILNSRVKFLIDPDSETVKKYLLSNYLPAVSGNLHILNLRSRFSIEETYFTAILAGIEELLESLSADFSVQSHFGKRWFINTISNLKTAQSAKNILPPIKRAIITGAGPSLEFQMASLIKNKESSFLIATDTSLPFLIKNKIKPDLVISIDCQHITFHHFFAGIPKEIPLVLDLASPAWLTRQSDNIVFFTSGHPFSQYVNGNLRSFPYIDTSGGNVSHAAISLADKLGAKEILLYGVDFSYPEGKSYARGTYLYPYFMSTSNRFTTTESSFVSFIFYNKQTVTKQTKYGISYTTTPMISYKERLEKASISLNAKIIQLGGIGVPIKLPEKNISDYKSSNITPFFSAGSSSNSWIDFLKEYSEKLKKLPDPGVSLSEYYAKLTSSQKNLCTTLFPAAAALRRSGNDHANGAMILKHAIIWTIKQIETFIS
ncbi:MAG: motility associated factor glycosyltransferase family protein [Spirochaetales bacterium]|nr:motility associated factor glycosyltransferase family protein [Spirochaetales bacterium]